MERIRRDTRSDERFMQAALTQARLAAAAGEVPVGAVIVESGRIIARGYNRPVRTSDPTGHAEVVAIRRACRKKTNYRLAGCSLYVTIEPCAMCLGALIQARVARVVYGAADPKAGAVESVLKFPFERVNYRPEIRAGVLQEDCAALIRDFFKDRRKRPRARKAAGTALRPVK
jgi:tRNA(adenine34) deaminase